MLITNNKKYRDDFIAIVNYIKDSADEIDYYDFLNFVVSFEYYKVFYQNYSIFNDLILYHNSHLEHNDPVNDYDNDKSFDEVMSF